MSALSEFNASSRESAEASLMACCAVGQWAADVAARRPYDNVQELLESARKAFTALAEDDWLEAFASHPRIGERRAGTTAHLAHSSSEQVAAHATLPGVAAALIAGNLEYEERFGFRYIVFASGRSAPALLAVLQQRLGRTREEELREGARQQELITERRMREWLQPEGEGTARGM